jgi:hypothetical protein
LAGYRRRDFTLNWKSHEWLPVVAVGGKIPAMLVIVEVAIGMLLALGIWRLPTVYRRRKLRKWFLGLPSSEVILQAKRNDLYTNDQIELIIQLSLAQNQVDRESLASQIADSFPH